MYLLIVESSEDSVYKQDQNYMVMRSKLFSEKSLSLIENHMIAQVLNRFLDRVSTQIIYRYDIFKRISNAYNISVYESISSLK